MATAIHFRICHCCGTINCATGQLVRKCYSCGKQLAPFCFFDESRALGIGKSDYISKVKEAKVALLPLEDYPPIRGLTVYWE